MLWFILIIAAFGIFALIGKAIMNADKSSEGSDNNNGEKEKDKIKPKPDETEVHAPSNSNKKITAPWDTLVCDDEENPQKQGTETKPRVYNYYLPADLSDISPIQWHDSFIKEMLKEKMNIPGDKWDKYSPKDLNDFFSRTAFKNIKNVAGISVSPYQLEVYSQEEVQKGGIGDANDSFFHEKYLRDKCDWERKPVPGQPYFRRDIAEDFHYDDLTTKLESVEDLKYFTDIECLAIYSESHDFLDSLRYFTKLSHLKLENSWWDRMGDYIEYGPDGGYVTYRDDLSPLCHLTRLKSLSLGIGMWDLSQLSLLSMKNPHMLFSTYDLKNYPDDMKFRRVKFNGDCSENVDVLQKHREIEYLDMTNTNMDSIAPFTKLPKLKELYLHNNKIRSLYDLKYMTDLEVLDLGRNKIPAFDISCISQLHKLRYLNISYNPKVKDISELYQLPLLEELVIDGKHTKNFKVIVEMPSLKRLIVNDPSEDQIKSLQALQKSQSKVKIIIDEQGNISSGYRL